MKSLAPLFGLAAIFTAACNAPTQSAPAAAPLHASSLVAPETSTCFILRELDGPRRIRTGQACDEHLPPASTFKIPHTIIALDTGARSGLDDFEKWDGKNYGLDIWNRDQTLRTALLHSVVWYYQRTAVRV